VFKKISAAIEGLTSGEPTVNPERFGDPMALHTDWSPLCGGGSNFRSHKLDCSDANRWAFKVSIGAILFGSFFIGVGLGVIALSFWQDEKVLFMRAFGLVFAVAGSALLLGMSTPTVFDKQRGYFHKGRKRPEATFDRSKLKHYTELERIHALQLLAERVRSKNGSYLSYELNLVLIDGSRINVTDHGGHAGIRDDARKLAEFLDKPLWDAT
jgi:hypothetical protein